MNILFILSNRPGTETAQNVFKLAHEIVSQRPEVLIRIYLRSEAVLFALDTKDLPSDQYNIGSLLDDLLAAGAQICASDPDLRLADARKLELKEGVSRDDVGVLARWVIDANKVITEF